VILQKRDELVPVLAGRRIAVLPRTVQGRFAVVDESSAKAFATSATAPKSAK